ncbi:baseplate J/gp47 family protein [Pseudochelatococcus sp. B33]
MTLALDRPQIDYTNKDFESLRRALLDFAALRLPEWTDRNPSDFGMLMVDLFAYMGDVVLYYQDRLANESFLHTARERSSVLRHLRLIGYELAPPVPAGAELDLIFNPGLVSVTIPTGARFRAPNPDNPQVFEYRDPPLTVFFGSDQVEMLASGHYLYRGLPVVQGESVGPVVIGSSSGEPNQDFPLGTGPVQAESLRVEVNEGAGWVRWDRRESLLYDLGPDGRLRLSSPGDRVYRVDRDASGAAAVRFGGDGRFGRLPPRGAGNVRATYFAGGGAAGNVSPGAIREALTPVPNLFQVTNPGAAVGGVDAQTTAEAARIGPAAFRARERAVTLEDHAAMAFRAGGVAKARARASSWNRIDLFVAPAGPALAPVSESLRRRLIAFFEDRRMAGAEVRIFSPRAAEIEISAEIAYDQRYRADAVRQAALDAVNGVLAYSRVDFGQPVYLGTIHDALVRVAGVRGASIRRFRRRGAQGDAALDAALKAAGLPSVDALPDVLRAALAGQIEADGRIELDFDEIPVAGAVELTLMVAP